ncbi:hypothetical protein O181_114089 [Austropuccinia psidii MF-1]|uniref:Uncharacterized protein n=1 Tax=Austropuccinia psidii MF-1 TaxID=1389203 RepID=A0A9Q3K751_9BASI|nr:hypothetical protein [Austropuccinia psidii MF-1]
MPIQNSPPEQKTRSKARTQAVLTQTKRDPLDGTLAAPQVRAHLDRGAIMEGRKRAKKIEFIFWRKSDSTEASPASVGASQGTGGPTLAQYNQPVFHHSKPSLLAIMHQMTQIMENILDASSPGASRLCL